MNDIILSAWDKLKTEKHKKQNAIKRFRIERSVSQELDVRYRKVEHELAHYKCEQNGWIERRKYNELQTEIDELKMSLEKSNSLIDAYKSHVGRQMERHASTEECYNALKSTQKDFGEQIGIMESRAKTLQALIDFHKRRADEMREKLTSFEVNEGDSNYDIKQENDQLKAMLSHWVQRAKALEKQVGDKAEEASDLSRILDQNSNIQQQEMDAAPCLSIN